MNQPSESAKEVIEVLSKDVENGKLTFSRSDVSALLTVIEHFQEIVNASDKEQTVRC